MSRTPHSAADLLELVKSGHRKLTPKERRLVIAFLDDEGDQMSNCRMAGLFSVSEATIRSDRKALLAEFAKQLTPEFAVQYVARFLQAQEGLIRKARAGLDASQPGTYVHQNYLQLISSFEDRMFKTMQSIGVVDKNLGRLAVTEEIWVAEVSGEGITSLTRVPSNATDMTSAE